PEWRARYNLCVADARQREDAFKALRFEAPEVYCITYADAFAPKTGEETRQAGSQEVELRLPSPPGGAPPPPPPPPPPSPVPPASLLGLGGRHRGVWPQRVAQARRFRHGSVRMNQRYEWQLFFQQRHQARLLLRDLIESALARRLVGPPAQEAGSVAKPVAGE